MAVLVEYTHLDLEPLTCSRGHSPRETSGFIVDSHPADWKPALVGVGCGSR
jgi:hypothetical protein